MAIYVPILMYGLRLFIVVLQELHCLLNYLHVCMIRVRGWYHIKGFITLHFLVSEIVYCLRLFTRTTLFTTVIIVVLSLKSMCIPSFVLIGYCVYGNICAYRNVWPEAIYCGFKRTTLFTKLFTCLYDQS